MMSWLSKRSPDERSDIRVASNAAPHIAIARRKTRVNALMAHAGYMFPFLDPFELCFERIDRKLQREVLARQLDGLRPRSFGRLLGAHRGKPPNPLDRHADAGVAGHHQRGDTFRSRQQLR